MLENAYTPIKIKEPPRHTQIKNFRCRTCKKAPVCSVSEDYLKTALLIQNVLGDPQLDRQLYLVDTEKFYVDFRGFTFDNAESYLPETITTDGNDTGTFISAKYLNKDVIKFVYNIEDYHVMFQASWDRKEEEYKIFPGKEIYYGLDYKLSTESESLIIVGLGCWRTDMEEKEKEQEKKDIINTTHFTPSLDCEFYEYDRERVEREKREMFSPTDEFGSLKHVATYHIEPKKVPVPPRRRGDINNGE